MPTNLGGNRPANMQRILVGLVIVGLGLYLFWKNSQQPVGPQKDAKPAPAKEVAKELPAVQRTDLPSAKEAGLQTRIPNVTVRNLDGKVVFRGTVDVVSTLRRIERGEKLRFPNDGTVFQNREQRLPRKPAGYYREYVHPTDGLSGPGPQRIVLGKEGEAYFTHDHYRTFQRLDREEP